MAHNLRAKRIHDGVCREVLTGRLLPRCSVGLSHVGGAERASHGTWLTGEWHGSPSTTAFHVKRSAACRASVLDIAPSDAAGQMNSRQPGCEGRLGATPSTLRARSAEPYARAERSPGIVSRETCRSARCAR